MARDRLPSLREAGWLAAPSLQRVMRLLDGGERRTRVVGGAVRNALMGQPVADVDLATELAPEEVVRRAQDAGVKAVPTGMAHGTVTLIADHHPYEVTTLRRDVETDGRRATIAYTDDWTEDAKRRDFTINALYADMDGSVFDPLDGYADLAARRVRFIGDAAQRIAEDYLRILRFFRFFANYGGSAPDPAGVAACIAARAGLRTLSGERVRQELLRLLGVADPVPAIAAMLEAGLLTEILGGVAQPVLLRQYAAIEREHELPADPVRRLCLLACLIGEDAARLRDRLRLSRAEYARLAAAADGYWRLRPFMSRLELQELLYHRAEETYLDLVIMAWARAGREHDLRWADAYALPQRWRVPELPWSGSDLTARGMAPGPQVGACLKHLEKAWIKRGFPTEPDTLTQLLDTAVQKSHG